MSGKRFSDILKSYDFKAIQDELLMEFKANQEQLDLCKELFESLKEVNAVPSKLEYGIITSTANSGKKKDTVVAHADFMTNPLTIHELTPNDIVSAMVNLDTPDLESLFIALALLNLVEGTDNPTDDLLGDLQIPFEPEDDVSEVGEKIYSEESLFPFKKGNNQ